MSAPFFIVDRERVGDGATVHLDGPEGRHAATVRRLAPGEQVVLTDGRGFRADCRVTAVADGQLELAVEARCEVPRPEPRFVVVQALPKSDRGELAVEMMTEVGVDEVVPWAATRCVTHWKAERREKALLRWRTTAREAAKQARRAWIPDVSPLHTTGDVTQRLATAALAVVLHEEATQPLAEVAVPDRGDIVAVVGPEGGIAPEELRAFTDAGGVVVRLGPSVLRTSTAGTAALAVLLSRTAGWR